MMDSAAWAQNKGCFGVVKWQLLQVYISFWYIFVQNWLAYYVCMYI